MGVTDRSTPPPNQPVATWLPQPASNVGNTGNTENIGNTGTTATSENNSSALSDPTLLAALDTGEVVLWADRPDTNRLRAVYGIWLFAVPWTLFSVGWTAIAGITWLSSFSSGGNGVRAFGWLMPAFGLPFVGVGAWMLNKPRALIADAGKTVYALTNKRLLTVTDARTLKTRSVPLDKLGPVTCTQQRDGWGKLSVETGSHKDSDGDRVTDLFEFEGVPNVVQLDRLLRDAVERHRSPSGAR